MKFENWKVVFSDFGYDIPLHLRGRITKRGVTAIPKWSLCASSLRKICIHSSVFLSRCLAASMLITSLPLSHTVKLNDDMISVSSISLHAIILLLIFLSPLQCALCNPPAHSILSSSPLASRLQGGLAIPITTGISFCCNGPSETNRQIA